MNKDYLSLAREYVSSTPYRDLSSTPTCILCKSNPVSVVFFPCQHKCVCPSCMEKNNIGNPNAQGSWNFCPCCCGEIKIALESTGDEVERYWAWTREVKPYMPPNFVKAFHKRSTARIRRESGGQITDVRGEGGDGDGPRSSAGARVCAVM